MYWEIRHESVKNTPISSMFQRSNFPDVKAMFFRYCNDLQSVITLNGLDSR